MEAVELERCGSWRGGPVAATCFIFLRGDDVSLESFVLLGMDGPVIVSNNCSTTLLNTLRLGVVILVYLEESVFCVLFTSSACNLRVKQV